MLIIFMYNRFLKDIPYYFGNLNPFQKRVKYKKS